MKSHVWIFLLISISTFIDGKISFNAHIFSLTSIPYKSFSQSENFGLNFFPIFLKAFTWNYPKKNFERLITQRIHVVVFRWISTLNNMFPMFSFPQRLAWEGSGQAFDLKVNIAEWHAIKLFRYITPWMFHCEMEEKEHSIACTRHYVQNK